MTAKNDHLIEVQIMPKSKEDRKKIQKILSGIAKKDSSYCSFIDRDTGQIILGGISESHLEAIIIRLKDEHKMTFEVGAPQINYHRQIINEKLTLWEPVMFVDIITPQKFSAAIASDLHNRRGRINDKKKQKDDLIINAEVPLASMFGYLYSLRTITQGTAINSMRFSHYAQAPISDDDPSPFRPAMAMRVMKGS